jgi:TetR/AcrR family transcriptional regulator, cholesterol catabolism regulator
MPKQARATGHARDRVLEIAEQLFMKHGYNGVSMREIAAALGVKQPALYYHAPQGKHQLFLAVLERAMTRHRIGLSAAIAAAAPDVRAQLRVVVRWLIQELHLNLTRLAQVDLPALPAEVVGAAENLVWESLYLPIAQIFIDAQARGEVGPHEPGMLAAAAIALIDSIRAYGVPEEYTGPPIQLGDRLVDVLLDGVWVKE